MFNNASKPAGLLPIAVTLCALLIATISGTVMAGWILHSEPMVSLMLSFSPMQFNPALCFLCLCVAFLALGRHPFISAGASAISVIVGLLTLAEYVTQLSNGIDTFFNQPFMVVNAGHPGRMAINTAVGFCLEGIALLCATGKGHLASRRAFFAALMASLVIAIGAVPLLGNLFSLQTVMDLGSGARTSFYSGICFLMLGAATISYAWGRTRDTQYWLPIPLFMAIIVVAYCMSQAAVHQEEAEFESAMQIEVTHLVHDADVQLANFYRALDRIANRWKAAKGTPRDIWERDTEAYIHDYPYLSGLSKTDTDTRIEWITSTQSPNPNQKSALGFKLDSEPRRAAAIAHVLATGKGQATKVVKLIGSGDKGFLYILPLYAGDQYQGLQIAVMRTQQIFDMLLNIKSTDNYYVTVSEDEAPFYSTLPAGMTSFKESSKSAIIHNKDTLWTVTVSPTPMLLAKSHSLIPFAIILGGFICAVLITTSITLMLKWRSNAKVLRLREQTLEEQAKELRQLTVIVEESSDFIGVADLSGNLLYHNRSARRITGYPDDYDLSKMGIIDMHPAWVMQLLSTQALPSCFETGSWQGETALLHRDGHEIPVLQNITLLRDAKGTPLRTTTIMRDISQLKAAEATLRRSEEQFRSAMEHAAIGKALVSTDGKFIKVNAALCKMLGYERDELIALSFQQIETCLQANREHAAFTAALPQLAQLCSELMETFDAALRPEN